MTKIINGVASEFEFPADTGVFTQNILEKENEILRKNAEHNDKVVDKVNWENMLLKKENQELKKQLKERTKTLLGRIIELKEVINKVIKIFDECKLLMPHEFDWGEQVDNVLDILKEVSE